MVLTRAALSEYDERIRSLGDAAYGAVRKRIASFLARFPGATVAETRDFAVESVNAAVMTYGDAASTCAADLYDQMAESAGATLPPAVLDTSDVAEYIEKEIRYQAGKLVAGKTDEFADAVARNAQAQTQRRANDTMTKNVKRDGVRYARVPLGFETCTFCLMLASQGFVYKSAKTAGAHYHDNCRCKVVPSFSKGGKATKVEGYDPDALYKQWEKYKEIDGLDGYSYAEKRELKAMLCRASGLSVQEIEKSWRERAAGYVSNMDAVNSKAYRSIVGDIFGQALGDIAWKDMRHTLKVKSGKPYEHMYAYDLTAGVKLGSITDSKEELQVSASSSLLSRIRGAAKSGHSVVIMHNHPGSSLPSAVDVASIATNNAAFGVIACHDGSIIKFAPSDNRYLGYNMADLEVVDKAVNRIIASKRLRGAQESEYLSTIEAEAGVTIERFVVC